jgi:hypothetical protein
MKKLLPSLLAGAACAMALALAPAQAQNKPQDKVTLMLNWYLYSEHAPFFLGKERGYFAEEGIDLDIQEGRGSAVTAQAVAAKSAPSELPGRGMVKGEPTTRWIVATSMYASPVGSSATADQLDEPANTNPSGSAPGLAPRSTT